MLVLPCFAVKDFPATSHIHSGNAAKVWDVIEEIQSNRFLFLSLNIWMLKMEFYSILAMEWIGQFLPTPKWLINVMLKCLRNLPFFPPANNGSHKISIQYLAEKELVVDVSAVVSVNLGVILELHNACSDTLLPLLSLFRGAASQDKAFHALWGRHLTPNVCNRVR